MKYQVPDHIECKRIVLRKFCEDDWKDLVHYYTDEECMKYTSGRALEEWEGWRLMAAMVGHWELRGYGPYAVEERQTGNVLGTVGLWYPIEWPSPEIKWGLVRNAWGKGFASEAAEYVRQMASKYLPEIQLISLIDPKNTASINVAKKLGATYEKTVPFRDGRPVDIYRHKK